MNKKRRLWIALIIQIVWKITNTTSFSFILFEMTKSILRKKNN